nr:MAG TPA: hypothetical protein [Caudoviricetes sp.]
MELLQLAIQRKRQKRYVINIVETTSLCTTIQSERWVNND